MNQPDDTASPPELGSIRARVCAATIDHTLFALVVHSYCRIFGEAQPGGVGVVHVVEGASLAPLLLMWLAYFPTCEFLFGCTIGKRFLGLQVTSAVSTECLSFPATLKRHVLDLVDVFFAFGIVGILTMAHSDHRQRLGDRWARTLVTKRLSSDHGDN